MTKTYSEKLLNPLWQRKRLEIFQRDNFTCVHCNAKHKTLAIHHLDYFDTMEPWEYPNDLLVTVCQGCHNEEQARHKHEKYLLNSLKMKGFLAVDILLMSVKIDQGGKFCESLKKILRSEHNTSTIY